MARMWDLNDLVGLGDIAAIYGVQRAAVSNWINRYGDFPEQLTRVSGAPVFSRKAVQGWHKAQWPAGQPERGRTRGVAQK